MAIVCCTCSVRNEAFTQFDVQTLGDIDKKPPTVNMSIFDLRHATHGRDWSGWVYMGAALAKSEVR